MSFRQRAAEDGEILRKYKDQPAVDGARAGDDAIAGDDLFGHAEIDAIMFDIHVEFFERIGIEQYVEPLARGQPALLVLGFHALGAAAGTGGFAAAFKFGKGLEHHCPRGSIASCLAAATDR